MSGTVEQRLADTSSQVVAALKQAGQTLAVAESLTGGMLCSTIVDVPGASTCLRGGICTYGIDTKWRVLGVDRQLLERRGAVSAEVASQMAAGAAELFVADWALSTTGVAGPDSDDYGNQPGIAYVGIHRRAAATTLTRLVEVPAQSRQQVRQAAVIAALEMLLQRLH